MVSPKNIFLIRLKSIGDVVLTLPAVSVLRRNFPEAKITFLTSEENLSLLRGFRDVNESFGLDRSALRGGHPVKMAGELFRLLRRLRNGKFSLAVDFQSNGESAWLAWLTGATQRWGVVQKSARRRAYTSSLDHQPQLHAAESHLALLRHCGLGTGEVSNEFVLPTDALDAARTFLAAHKFTSDRPVLFVQPFTSTPAKDWPLENFLNLARHWQSRGWRVLFGGGPGDRAALEPVRAAGFAVSAGVPLLVTGGLMQLAALTVGGDTGALHLAVAQGKRVVMLMNNNWPGHPHPFQHPDWVIVPPDNQTIAKIKFATVIAACEQALN